MLKDRYHSHVLMYAPREAVTLNGTGIGADELAFGQ